MTPHPAVSAPVFFRLCQHPLAVLAAAAFLQALFSFAPQFL